MSARLDKKKTKRYVVEGLVEVYSQKGTKTSLKEDQQVLGALLEARADKNLGLGEDMLAEAIENIEKKIQRRRFIDLVYRVFEPK
jgi:hypothetical protein